MTRITYNVHGHADHGDHWRDQALCATPQFKRQAELWFPHPTNQEAIRTAKNVCNTCPVREACLAAAMAEEAGQGRDKRFGIRGGTTESERLTAYRQAKKADGKPQPAKQQHLPRPTTLTEAFARRTQRTADGHVIWRGFEYIQFQGQRYSAMQAAFIVGHGRNPEGVVRRIACGVECFRWDHLTDAVIRNAEACGTRNGYRLHLRRGEQACARCRKANTDADNRLRRTGTTKVLA